MTLFHAPYKLHSLICGFCRFNLNRLLCMDLAGNHRWICISWKEKGPQLPEHKGQRLKTYTWKHDKLCSSSLWVLQQPANILIIPIYRCPMQFVIRPLCSQYSHGSFLFKAMESINLIINMTHTVLSLQSVIICYTQSFSAGKVLSFPQ